METWKAFIEAQEQGLTRRLIDETGVTLAVNQVEFPKSVTSERIEENFNVFDFHLSESEMAAMEALDAGERSGPDPDKFVRP